jgi:hypothetical protein
MIGITGKTKLSKDALERHGNRSVSRNLPDPDDITSKKGIKTADKGRQEVVKELAPGEAQARLSKPREEQPCRKPGNMA